MREASNAIGCRYVGAEGEPCPEPMEGGGEFCFWHDPSAPKTGPEVKHRLEELALQGRSLEGFVLKGADLRGIHLTLRKRERGVNLSHADLSRANLADAHCFNIDLRGSNLMKADLTLANLNRAYMEDANLLGADLSNARLEQVNWGRRLHQEILAREAEREGKADEAMHHYQEAEEVYRHLTAVAEAKGHNTQAGHFYHKEKIMRRMQMRRWSSDWLWSKLIDLLCGYGEDVNRVIIFSLLIIIAWALIYFFIGLNGEQGPIRLDPQAGLVENVQTLLTDVYYSVVTFTTLGYGDITPTGIARFFAALEAFIGAFSIALFVVVFVRKMTR